MHRSKARLNARCQVPLDGSVCIFSTMGIGEKIRRARLARKMSLEALGRIVGVSRSAVHQWEQDEVDIKLENRIKLSAALSLPIAELLPPEATAGEVTIRAPNALLLHKLFGSMTELQQEAYLKLLLVMGSEEGQAPQPSGAPTVPGA